MKAAITRYASHDVSVAKVDGTYGTITAVSAGHTYIDIVTDKGTAVYEVFVFDTEDMFGDYSFAFGKTVQEIVDVKGRGYLWKDDHYGVIYLSDDYLADTVRYITGTYDNSHIEYAQLCLNGRVSKSEIKQHLDEKYGEPLSATDGRYSYATGRKAGGNPVAAIYDSNSSILSFAQIQSADRWADFSSLFGQTRDAVKAEMGERSYSFMVSDYSYSKDGSDYYTINDSEDAYMTGFVFNSEGKMCEYWVYPNENFRNNVKDILAWLKSKYVLSEQESGSTQRVYYDKQNRVRIVFDPSGYVRYTDRGQTPFTPGGRVLTIRHALRLL